MQRLFHLRRVGPSFESPRSLLKWLFISTSIGLVAGFGALAFSLSIQFTTPILLGGLVGYLPPDPTGEGKMGVMSLCAVARPWLLPLVTTLGGLVSGIIVFTLAPEAEGHGTDAAIAAFHQGKPIRARIPLVKLVASAITSGSGGSGGREGPAAQISAGFGSLLGTLVGEWRVSRTTSASTQEQSGSPPARSRANGGNLVGIIARHGLGNWWDVSPPNPTRQSMIRWYACWKTGRKKPPPADRLPRPAVLARQAVFLFLRRSNLPPI